MNYVITERAIKIKSKNIKEFGKKVPVPQDIKDEFKEDDELWYFNDFGIAPKMCEREAIFLVRNGIIIKDHLLRMS